MRKPWYKRPLPTKEEVDAKVAAIQKKDGVMFQCRNCNALDYRAIPDADGNVECFMCKTVSPIINTRVDLKKNP